MITIGTRVAGDRLDITVEDTGTGIPSDILHRVFDPLFSTKSFGTGLGLAVVKQVVEQHRGRIEIASVPGKGTKVTLLLPLAAQSAARAAA